MAEDLGRSVSYVSDPNGYAYDTVVWQKEKPILDTEQNLVQQIQGLINRRQSVNLPSGWLSVYPAKTDVSLPNQFYTQDPTSAKPEYALVNGMVLHVTNTEDERDNVNKVDLGTAPTTGNRISGIFLEAWRALLDPNSSANRPGSTTVLDAVHGVFMWSEDIGWLCGQNGLILYSSSSSANWVLQNIASKKNLNGLYFVTSGIGWVVGDNGTLGRTVSAGDTWNMLTSPTTENLNSVHAYSQLIAWAVGDSGTILKTTNGITWSIKNSGVTANLNKVHFYDQQVGWAVGDNGTILKTTDGGTVWVAQTSGVTSNLRSVHFWGLSYGFAVGDNGTILKTADGGATWGDVSGNIFESSVYTRWYTDFNDVCLIPTIDEHVINEEVTSQFDGVNKVCVVEHNPITKGDGKGTTTNLPSDVTVTVNGSPVLVDAVNGSTGAITLNVAPVAHATVMVSYWYKSDCPVFMGKAWIVGNGGKALRTDNIGAQWIPLTTGKSQDLYSVDFVDGDQGWAVGDSAVILHTEDAGNTWSEESSSAVARTLQRVFKEGNIDTDIFLNDDTIHPDAAVETTKRVQMQYRIRVVNGIDPDATPEAGLSSSIKGIGPNLTGQFPYENMGASTGDYGLWRAKCLNTVDGYCWAVPMFIAARRNSSAYDPATNPNGEHKPGTFIRPDLLTAAMVVDGDLLDVRRKVIVPSLTELFESDLDLLSRNRMLTVMARQSGTGDQYGSQLLQIDRVGAGTGGDPIAVNLNTVASGSISAALTFNTQSFEVDAESSPTPNPTEQVMPSISGLYSQNPWDYSAIYNEGIYAGQQVEGYWEGIGTPLPKFVFSVFIKNQDDDSGLQKYKLTAKYNSPSASSLNRLPYNPQLTQNIGAGEPTVWYHGILDSLSSKTIETWDSTIPGHPNYAVVYPAKDSSDTDQRNRASSVELHLFYTIGTTGLTLQVPQQEITVVSGDFKWKIYSVSKVNNITSGFSHKIQNIQFLSPGITVTAAAGYTFVQGAVVEVVSYAVALEGATRWQGIRNGASVNFTERTKAVNNFVESRWVEASIIAPFSYVDISLGSAVLYGATTVETVSGLAQHSFWYGPSLSSSNLQAGVLSGWGTNTARMTFATALIGKIWIQLLVKQTQLPYPDPNEDSLLIAYNYIPKQTVPSLPSSLTLDVVTAAPVIVSTLGIAGGAAGSPYDNPIEHIPVNGTITTGVPEDAYLGNYDPLCFHNYSIDSGYVRLPTLIPAGVGQQITLSSASTDAAGRTFYQTCSVDTQFSAEGLVTTVPRKVYAPILARVKACSDGHFEVGEYVLVVFSKSTASDKENTVGSSDAIGVYRLPNKPICKV